MNRAVRLSVYLLLVSVILSLAVVPSVQARPSREDLNRALQSTVLILTLDNGFNVIATGSGSIVDSRGLILSNFHVVGDVNRQQLYNSDGIVGIAITRDVRLPAVPVYLAEVVRGNPALDLALLRVVSDVDGNSLRGCQTLPFYELGDSDLLQPSDELTIIGFPGIGGESVTVTSGDVSGFLSANGVVDLIKTDAEINPGNSGGSAINDDGDLVGIPTFTAEGQEGRQGKLGLVRPVNLALDMLENLPGLGVAGCAGGSQGSTPGTTPPVTPGNGQQTQAGTLSMLGIGLDQEGAQFIDQAPDGTTELYAHFQYSGISASTPFASHWTLNGQIMEDTRLAFDEWPLDPGSGTAFVSTEGENGLAAGTYTIEIQAGSLAPITGQIEVGGEGSSQAAASAEVILRGRVRSADTGKAIPRASVAVLTPGITWDSFDPNNPDHILDLARTNSRGLFEMNVPLELEGSYSLGILANRFQPVLVDEFIPSEFYEGGNFIDLGDITLKRE